jgi:hypothetical protein
VVVTATCRVGHKSWLEPILQTVSQSFHNFQEPSTEITLVLGFLGLPMAKVVSRCVVTVGGQSNALARLSESISVATIGVSLTLFGDTGNAALFVGFRPVQPSAPTKLGIGENLLVF